MLTVSTCLNFKISKLFCCVFIPVFCTWLYSSVCNRPTLGAIYISADADFVFFLPSLPSLHCANILVWHPPSLADVLNHMQNCISRKYFYVSYMSLLLNLSYNIMSADIRLTNFSWLFLPFLLKKQNMLKTKGKRGEWGGVAVLDNRQ